MGKSVKSRYYQKVTQEKVTDGNASKHNVFTEKVADGNASKHDITTESHGWKCFQVWCDYRKQPRGQDGIGCPLTVLLMHVQYAGQYIHTKFSEKLS